jgi:hypothetical protein
MVQVYDRAKCHRLPVGRTLDTLHSVRLDAMSRLHERA